jgi:hypothetical protein
MVDVKIMSGISGSGKLLGIAPGLCSTADQLNVDQRSVKVDYKG